MGFLTLLILALCLFVYFVGVGAGKLSDDYTNTLVVFFGSIPFIWTILFAGIGLSTIWTGVAIFVVGATAMILGTILGSTLRPTKSR